jgi:hypothetical protein
LLGGSARFERMHSQLPACHCHLPACLHTDATAHTMSSTYLEDARRDGHDIEKHMEVLDFVDDGVEALVSPPPPTHTPHTHTHTHTSTQSHTHTHTQTHTVTQSHSHTVTQSVSQSSVLPAATTPPQPCVRGAMTGTSHTPLMHWAKHTSSMPEWRESPPAHAHKHTTTTKTRISVWLSLGNVCSSGASRRGADAEQA